MNIIDDFTNRFPNEETCIQYLRKQRQDKLTCKRCGNNKHYWISSIHEFQCSECNSRTSLTTDTVMYKSKVSIRQWFMCIHLMTTVKKPFSALEMKRVLDLKSYDTAWNLMRKVRIMMGKRDARYQLSGHVEMDEGYFRVYRLPNRDQLGNRINEDTAIVTKKTKRGRGTDREIPVLLAVESTPTTQTKKYAKNRKMGYVKMTAIDSANSQEINYEAKNMVNKDATVHTDGFNAYNKITEVVKNHVKMIVPPKDAMKKLPWIHTQIANCKRELLGIHHSIKDDYLQLYLNEFCYKVNRRNFKLRDNFDGLIIACLDGCTLY